jgi:Uma2 family endonuclease
VVIEVMSPGSKPRDERVKRAFYGNLPTIRHIVLVDAERMTVEHDVQTEGGYDRSILTAPEAVIDLTAIGFSIALEKVYSGPIARWNFGYSDFRVGSLERLALGRLRSDPFRAVAATV